MSQISDTAVINATGGLVELGYSEITSAVLPTSISASSPNTVISDLTVVCDGSPILVEFFSNQVRPTNSAATDIKISLYQDGSEETREWGRFYNGVSDYDNKPCYLSRRLTPSAGSHTYKVTAFVSSGTGYIGAGPGGTLEAPTFLRVSKIVTASEWPAINEQNRIICTSSTRPSAPYEGIKIYETDTDRELVYDSSAWVQTNSIGGWSTWTPEVYQNGTRSSTANYAKYTRIGDTAIVQAKISMTAAGQAGYQIEVRDLPYGIAGNSTYLSVGGGMYWDQNFRWLLHAESWAATNTTITFGYDSAAVATYAGGRFGEHPSKAIVSGDFLTFYLNYEIA